jgi:deoxyribodipyrimidine photo-lyase
MNTQLVWFRNDLRADDNSALIQAMNAGPAVAVYIATPAQWQMHDDAPIKIDFWRRNLQELESSLQAMNVPLYYFQLDSYAEVPALIENILKNWGIAALHCNAEYPVNECVRDDAVKAVCTNNSTTFHIYEDQCLLPPDFVLTAEGNPFKVFTPFAKKSRLILESSGPVKSYGINISESAEKFQKELTALDSQCGLDDIDWPQAEPEWQQLWPAGEKAAKQCLDEFIESKIDNYKEARDIPSLNGTSTLSPYLTSGVISVRACWEAAESIKQNSSAATWRNELLWRDFYKYVLYHYPYVCKHQPWNSQYKSIPWRENEEEFERWCKGETGFPIIDAAMKQLLQTGWMHNRLRMVVAMFLSKNLLIDWRWGERWFMQHLIDGDFAANNGGWQWSASTGTDAAPYFRLFNPIRQSERFDARGEFIKHFIPELKQETDKSIHDPAKISTDYFAPMVDLQFSRERCLAAFKEHKA